MNNAELKDYLVSKFADKVSYLETSKFEPIFIVEADNLLEITKAIRDDEKLQINYLCNIAAVDWKDKFEVVYSLLSVDLNHRVELKVDLPHDNPEIESVQEIWPAANWYEREIWELFGINVLNHGNLKRFLLPDDWDQGHPMLKDWDAPDFIRMEKEEK
jgi:NADH:ubiquinone oxidoreductase subunit C